MTLQQFEPDLAKKLAAIINRGGITDPEIVSGELIIENEDYDSQTDYKNSLKNDY